MARKKIVEYKRPTKYATRKDKGIPRGLTKRTQDELWNLGTPLSKYLLRMNLKFDTVAAGFGIGVHALRKWLYNGIEPKAGIRGAVKFISRYYLERLSLNESEMKIEAKLFSAQKRSN